MASITPNMSLKTWDLLGDNFSHGDLATNFDLIDTHDHTVGKGIQISSGAIANGAVGANQIQAGAVGTSQLGASAVTGAKIANTTITGGKLTNQTITSTQIANQTITATQIANNTLTPTQFDVNTVQAILGLNGALLRRGKSNIATSESRTNTAYGLLTTADRVSNIVLPTDGLIAICYQATWKESVANAARAAIFVGANQVKIAGIVSGFSALAPAECSTHLGSANIDLPIFTASSGLMSISSGAATNYPGDATTGQIVGGFFASAVSPAENEWFASGGTLGGPIGGPCYIFAAAGTYDVSVQFKASSGSVTAKNRHLWVWTLGF